MPTGQTESIERLVFEGPLSLSAAWILGIATALLIGWLAWHEARRSRIGVVLLFWGLRVTAVSIVFWMLLGPSNERVLRESQAKSILFLVDDSESMKVVDPSDVREDVRWNMAPREENEGRLYVACDSAVVASAAAQGALDRASAAIGRGETIKQIGNWLRSAHAAAKRASEHLHDLETDPDSGSGGFAAQAGQIAETLDDSVLPVLAELVGEVDDTEAGLDQQEWTSVEVLVGQLDRVARRTRRLAAGVLEHLDARVNTPEHRELLHDRALRRSEKVANLLRSAEQSWLGELADSVNVRKYRFDARTTLAGDGDESTGGEETEPAVNASEKQVAAWSTNLSAALEQITHDAANEMVEAAVVFTDGRHNAPQARDPRDVAGGFHGLPVHVVPIGNSEMLRDVVLHHVEAPSAVAVNDRIVVEALVSTYDTSGETCVVELSENNQVLDRQEIEITAGRSDHRVVFTTKSDLLGRHSFQLRAHPLDAEADVDNNESAFHVDVIDDTVRVLLSDHLPRWEFRYLVNLFTRDERIEFEQLVFGPERRGTGTLLADPSFPADADGWSRYRVAILGDVAPKYLDMATQEALKEYVTRRGGTLVVIAGRNYMPQAFRDDPLGSLVPVVSSNDGNRSETGYSLELSSEGLQLDAMQIADDELGSNRVWQTMSRSLPVYGLSEFSEPKPTARTLIHAVPTSSVSGESGRRSFLCWQQVGRGRVVYLAAPVTYQLRLRTGDRYHHRFWGQLIRWAIARELAAGSKTVRIRTDRPRYNSEDPVQVIVQMAELDGAPVREADVIAEAVRDDEVAATIPLKEDENIPGRYLGQFDSLPPGSFVVRAGGIQVERLLSDENYGEPVETSVSIDPPLAEELRDTRSNRPLLAQIAELTGGQVLQPTAVKEVFQLADLAPKITEHRTQSPMWNSWTALWIVLGCLTLEWAARKQIGYA